MNDDSVETEYIKPLPEKRPVVGVAFVC